MNKTWYYIIGALAIFGIYIITKKDKKEVISSSGITIKTGPVPVNPAFPTINQANILSPPASPASGEVPKNDVHDVSSKRVYYRGV